MQISNVTIVINLSRRCASARLAQSVEHETLNLRVVGSSPTLGDNFCCCFLFSFYSAFLLIKISPES